jgi:hypothetical protein
MMADAPDALPGAFQALPDLRLPNGMTLEGLEAVSEIIRPLIVGNLPDATVEALKESRMDDRHAALNALMQD